MNIQNWKIFDKKGSNLNWIPLSTVNLKIESPTGKNAEGFLIVDPSGFVVDTKITNEGYLYDNNDVSVFYTYDYATGVFPLSSTEATIITSRRERRAEVAPWRSLSISSLIIASFSI